MPNTASYSQAENRMVRHDTLESDNSGLDAITAFPTGGQAGAIPLTGAVNRVTVVGTAGDSVLLPPATAGADVTVINAAAANSLNVFPSTGDAINLIAANGAFAIAATKVVTFRAAGAGRWHTLLTA